MRAINMLLVGDMPCVPGGLRLRLSVEPDLTVVDEAGDGAGVRGSWQRGYCRIE